MRILTLCILCCFLYSCKRAPVISTTGCEEFSFDLTDGTMNGVKPNLPQNQIKEWMPCPVRVSPEGGRQDCGGGLFYDQHHFAYYTYLYDYIEVRTGFQGQVSDSLLAKNRQQVRSRLGIPVKNELSEAYPSMDFFKTEYGCIRVEYKNDLPVLIGAHYTECETLDWCGKTE